MAPAHCEIPDPPRRGRTIYRALGFAALGLAAAGVVLPLLPTTPFLLVAGWAFARSSPAMEEWLLSHPRFGPALRQWRDKGAISMQAKWAALATMAASGAVSLYVLSDWILGGLVGLVLLGIGGFVASRPTAR